MVAHAGNGWYDVTVISPLNYFTYTPLLPGAATGTVELRSITEAVRSLVAGAPLPFESLSQRNLEQTAATCCGHANCMDVRRYAAADVCVRATT